jgi:glycosyltransferase involved in cell wall biosynthesis
LCDHGGFGERVVRKLENLELFSRLAGLARRRRLHPIAALVHRQLIAQELTLVRLLDGRSPPPGGDAARVRQVTALIKTFERPHVLQRLVSSIERRYPALRVIVVDDSRRPIRLPGVETVVMPFNSGISAGRNEGLRRVRTKYVLVLDDDLVFYRGTALAEAVALIERHSEIDIMGGRLIQLPFFRTSHPGQIFYADAAPVLPLGSAVGDLTVCDKANNFFLARTDRLRLVPWDPELKLVEHADFFTRALGVLTTVHNPDLTAFHARTPFDRAYMRRRLDYAAFKQIVDERYLADSPPTFDP